MTKRNYTGFTMIEILLVFAIGGMIFAMVFLALPGLMANRRDSERRDDVMLLINRLKNFQANNNRGALPSVPSVDIMFDGDGNIIESGNGGAGEWIEFYKDYMGDNFLDPDGQKYKLEVLKCNVDENIGGTGVGSACLYDKSDTTTGVSDIISTDGFAANDYTMHVVIQAKCDGTNAVKSNNNRNVAVVYRLEQADVFCSNS